MHFRRKHPTGKPQYRKQFSDWKHPHVEKGTSKHSNWSVVKAAQAAKKELKEYMHLSSNG